MNSCLNRGAQSRARQPPWPHAVSQHAAPRMHVKLRASRRKVADLDSFDPDHHGHDGGADAACSPPAIRLEKLRQMSGLRRRALRFQLGVAAPVREALPRVPLISASAAVQAQNKRAAAALAGCPQLDPPPISYAFSTCLASIYACRACNTTTWVGAIPTQDPSVHQKGHRLEGQSRGTEQHGEPK